MHGLFHSLLVHPSKSKLLTSRQLINEQTETPACTSFVKFHPLAVSGLWPGLLCLSKAAKVVKNCNTMCLQNYFHPLKCKKCVVSFNWTLARHI